MSAYVVDKTHVDLLVRAALKYGDFHDQGRLRWWRGDDDGRADAYVGWRQVDLYAETREGNGHVEFWTPSQVGQMLVSENVRSVCGRYPDVDPDAGNLPGPTDAYYMGPYVYADPGYELTPAEVFKAIDCLDYQSCEHDEWSTSEAFQFLYFLRQGACTRVDGYNDAVRDWDAADLEEARR